MEDQEEIVYSPELTIPDTLVLRNLADDIQRHRKTSGSAKIDRDEGYISTNSAATEPINCA
jgi:hypothetical protein